MRTADFDFFLPSELIAQEPTLRRDESRLLVLHRQSGRIEHRQFRELPQLLRAGDVLVLNNSRVIPARLRGVNAKTGGSFEMLLLEENTTNDWWVMLKPGKRARVGTDIEIRPCCAGALREGENPKSEIRDVRATVIEANAEGHRRLHFEGTNDILGVLDEIGEIPLPPYIRRDGAPSSGSARKDELEKSEAAARDIASFDALRELDRERYQTVFAQPAGSVAAPTAGLHFTDALLAEIRARGVEVRFLTLHVGLGTFAPVKAETVEGHMMHEERYEISEAAAAAVNAAKAEGRRVIAVGTTTVRALESAAEQNIAVPRTVSDSSPERVPERPTSSISPTLGRTKIFIHPPHRFQVVDALLTNFHLPRSTLLMLVSAFASPSETRGRELILSAYAEAIRERYRFFSYGDAMLIL